MEPTGNRKQTRQTADSAASPRTGGLVVIPALGKLLGFASCQARFSLHHSTLEVLELPLVVGDQSGDERVLIGYQEFALSDGMFPGVAQCSFQQRGA